MPKGSANLESKTLGFWIERLPGRITAAIKKRTADVIIWIAMMMGPLLILSGNQVVSKGVDKSTAKAPTQTIDIVDPITVVPKNQEGCFVNNDMTRPETLPRLLSNCICNLFETRYAVSMVEKKKAKISEIMIPESRMKSMLISSSSRYIQNTRSATA